jgi:predicted GIY-YIG superfamily endonuclease
VAELSERTALYRLYGADDRLLYVGISSNPKGRLGAHSRDKHWWPEVARHALEWFETRKSAERIEKIEVEEERPRYNKVFNGDRRTELYNEGVARLDEERREAERRNRTHGPIHPPFRGVPD